ncbi:MAG: hypothetical protein ABIY52_16185, partial [Gemmatimonadaceae bacterium]
MRHAITVATFLLLSACSAQQSASRDSAADTAGARASVATLEADARALAKMTGCTSANQCRTAPVGSRPCGGPRSYLAYC